MNTQNSDLPRSSGRRHLEKNSELVPAIFFFEPILHGQVFARIPTSKAVAIEIEKERMATPKLTREIVYEKKAAKYEGVGRLAHKLRKFYKF